MRRQDELIALYPGRDAVARKYLLSQMEEIPLAFDSEELLYFLQGQVADPDAMIRDQAVGSLGRFLEGYVRKRYALARQSAGVWTTFNQEDAAAAEVAAPVPEDAGAAARRMEAALGVLAPLAQALARTLPRCQGAARFTATAALGKMPVSTSSDVLVEAARRDHDTGSVLALARMGTKEAASAALEILRERGAREPGLLLALRDLDHTEAWNLLMDLVPRTDLRGRMNLAQALDAFPDRDPLEAVKKLCRKAEPWVIISCLNSLENIGDPAHLPMVKYLYQRVPHEFVRVQAIRAAGGIAHPDSIALCREALERGSDPVKAVALESVVRLKVDPKELRDSVTPLLASPQLKARVNAMLAILELEEALRLDELRQLLLSEDPLWRLEGAFLLGYFQSNGSLELLDALAFEDPAPRVRHQAAKSFSKYPATQSMGRLMRLVQDPDRALAATATRVLARYEGEEGLTVAEDAAYRLGSTQDPEARAALTGLIGTLAVKTPSANLSRALRAGLAGSVTPVTARALEGCSLLGDLMDGEMLKLVSGRTEDPDPRLRSRALLGLWNAGELGAAQELAAMVASPDDATARAGLEAALELGLLLEEAVAGGPRSARLCRALEARSPDAAARPRPLEEPVGAPRREPSRSESDFVVRKVSLREARGAPASKPSGTVRAIGAAELRTFLADDRTRKAALGDALLEKLMKVTYLISDAVTHSTALSSLWEKPWGKAIVLSPLLLIPLLLLDAATGTEDIQAVAGSPEPAAMWTIYVQGTAKDQDGGELAAGRPLAEDMVLSTGERSELFLTSAAGSRLTLRSRSAVRYRGTRAPDARPHFDQPDGDVTFEFRTAPGIALSVGPHLLEGVGAARIAGRGRARRNLRILAGRFELSDPAGKRSTLPGGATVDVDPE